MSPRYAIDHVLVLNILSNTLCIYLSTLMMNHQIGFILHF